MITPTIGCWTLSTRDTRHETRDSTRVKEAAVHRVESSGDDSNGVRCGIFSRSTAAVHTDFQCLQPRRTYSASCVRGQNLVQFVSPYPPVADATLYRRAPASSMLTAYCGGGRRSSLQLAAEHGAIHQWSRGAPIYNPGVVRENHSLNILWWKTPGYGRRSPPFWFSRRPTFNLGPTLNH